MELQGREEEQKILHKLLKTKRAEMVAVYGRRRIGKTFLIRQAYAKDICFEMTGIQHGSLEDQLHNFRQKLEEYFNLGQPVDTPTNWLEAFQMLKGALSRLRRKRKLVIFMDELPWIATHKSGFLEALGHFWNDWLSKQHIVLVVCGSAASWMMEKVVSQKGGLHNRITRQIHLKPFTLRETESFLRSQGVRLDRYQLMQLYMAMGGVVYYLQQAEPGFSAAQIIDKAFFVKQAPLRNEFDNLYAALFNHHARHVAVIRTLAQKWKGMTRNELIQQGPFKNGGGLTKTLHELELSSFITAYQPFGRVKRQTLYRLTDEYSLFYLKFIERKKAASPGKWQQLMQKQAYHTWAGYAFESLCLKHVDAIVAALGLSAIYTEASSFFRQGNNERPGAQIDLIIDRADHSIHLCELKFYNTEFVFNKAYAKALRVKKEVFRQATKTSKQLFITFISPYGLLQNEHSTGLIDHSMVADALFMK